MSPAASFIAGIFIGAALGVIIMCVFMIATDVDGTGDL